MSTQIKRLRQSGSDFVPITLSEAVVVNCTDLPGLSGYGVTTLERVLRLLLGIIGTNAQDIDKLEQLTTEINDLLADKQDKLIPGNGIEILPNGVINATFSTTLYEIATSLPLPPSAENLNKIYIVPSGEESPNRYGEFICVQEGDNFYWESIGSLNSEVDLTDYLSKTEFGQWISTQSIQAVDVTSSEATGSVAIAITYPSGFDISNNTVFDYLV